MKRLGWLAAAVLLGPLAARVGHAASDGAALKRFHLTVVPSATIDVGGAAHEQSSRAGRASIVLSPPPPPRPDLVLRSMDYATGLVGSPPRLFRRAPVADGAIAAGLLVEDALADARMACFAHAGRRMFKSGASFDSFVLAASLRWEITAKYCFAKGDAPAGDCEYVERAREFETPFDVTCSSDSPVARPAIFAALHAFTHPGGPERVIAATPETERSAAGAGYAASGTEGYLFTSRVGDAVPLKRFWHPVRGDFFATATVDGEEWALRAGYQLMRVEGYVYPRPMIGTVPLKSYVDPRKLQTLTTATAAVAAAAVKAGYEFVRVEGYVYPEPP